MKLKLPSFSDSGCTFLSACGDLESPSSDLAASLREIQDEEFVARYKSNGEAALVRLFFHQNEGRSHIHMDLAPRNAFASPPKVTSTKAQIDKLLGRLEGKLLHVTVYGHYSADQIAIGSLLATVSLEAEVGELVMKLTGGELSFEGSSPADLDTPKPPAQSLPEVVPKGLTKVRWMARGGRTSLQLYLDADTRMDSDYLIRLFHTGKEAAFRIIGGPSGGKR